MVGARGMIDLLSAPRLAAGCLVDTRDPCDSAVRARAVSGCHHTAAAAALAIRHERLGCPAPPATDVLRCPRRERHRDRLAYRRPHTHCRHTGALDVCPQRRLRAAGTPYVRASCRRSATDPPPPGGHVQHTMQLRQRVVVVRLLLRW